MVTSGPSAAVRGAFGADGEPTALDGGQGRAWRVDDVVLKPADDPAESSWTQELLARIDPDGFRVAPPIATASGSWVHDGWLASRYLDGLRTARPRWGDIVTWGGRFSDAAERARRLARGDWDDTVLTRRTHLWAVADRVAWDEEVVALPPDARQVRQSIQSLIDPDRPPCERQFVHGDLAGNVFVDPAGVPVILDVSPYLRPRRWVEATVVVDATLWYDADVSLAADLAGTAEGRDLVGRALEYRLVAEHLLRQRQGSRPTWWLDPYRRVLAALEG